MPITLHPQVFKVYLMISMRGEVHERTKLDDLLSAGGIRGVNSQTERSLHCRRGPEEVALLAG